MNRIKYLNGMMWRFLRVNEASDEALVHLEERANEEESLSS